MTLKRFFYYNPFAMTTGIVVASGLGYNGRGVGEDGKVGSGKPTWNKIISLYVWELET